MEGSNGRIQKRTGDGVRTPRPPAEERDDRRECLAVALLGFNEAVEDAPVDSFDDSHRPINTPRGRTTTGTSFGIQDEALSPQLKSSRPKTSHGDAPLRQVVPTHTVPSSAEC